MISVTAATESWPLAGEFRISRGAKTAARVVTVRLDDGEHVGIGECLPYPRFGESPEATLAVLEQRFGRGRHSVSTLSADTGCMAANNALDCALWDLRAQREGRPVWEIAGLAAPAEVITAYTLSLAPPEQMAQAAAEHAGRQLLKLKLGGDDADRDDARLRAVRASAPDSTLIVDANEGWTPAQLEHLLPVAEETRVAMIEQPLPAGADGMLANLRSAVALGADESVRGGADLQGLRDRYQVLNVKLDKTGGLTRAIELCNRARSLDFAIMIGCMVATSLSMAPALLLAADSSYVDLDGPLLLQGDRVPGLTYRGSSVCWPKSPFWGEPRENQELAT